MFSLAVETCIKKSVILSFQLGFSWFHQCLSWGWGCLAGPMQQNFCQAVDTGTKNSVIGHFNLATGGSSDVNPRGWGCLAGPMQQNIKLSGG